jgi:hypothetical protein
MYRKIFKAEKDEDLMVELPKEYLNKKVEVIAFQVEDVDYGNEKADLEEAMKFFDSIHADMSNFKFDRDEANER